ncbi:hypothetical protein A1Q1_01888 [Trichosporon asahii var. asahii CBS 2479]|uniref:Uncharacterized protein n=1 Tax=Trichosporon asahii var. asahii (strain ATCC 90039 / CBS 2479 / JCM 2466 / KCTC 7840 / NBRC 103889/ NCYC 2677 / UAMH 7654) TaxID=1186058 RepID=J5T407_TRIAS|nr:hypothetical protein A1Q1_01888 [Trichosporon asahii var. asahii CBS 2479]EJT49031.1 hypothetical protein A1Q1_01888 [Trichosporon asahii var. asahii CBS 2479]
MPNIKPPLLFPKRAPANPLANRPEFTIQPHPAKTNDPRDLQRELAGGGPQTGAANVFNTPGIQLPNSAQAQNLEQPKSREELQAEMKKLNS